MIVTRMESNRLNKEAKMKNKKNLYIWGCIFSVLTLSMTLYSIVVSEADVLDYIALMAAVVATPCFVIELLKKK